MGFYYYAERCFLFAQNSAWCLKLIHKRKNIMYVASVDKFIRKVLIYQLNRWFIFY